MTYKIIWRVVTNKNKSIIIQNDDFNHNVTLLIGGDFRDSDQKLEYAQEIVRQLNKKGE